jgi:hypothetical protein
MRAGFALLPGLAPLDINNIQSCIMQISRFINLDMSNIVDVLHNSDSFEVLDLHDPMLHPSRIPNARHYKER